MLPIESPGRTVYGMIFFGAGGGLGMLSGAAAVPSTLLPTDGAEAGDGSTGLRRGGGFCSGERTTDEGGLEYGIVVSENPLFWASEGEDAANASAKANPSRDTPALTTPRAI